MIYLTGDRTSDHSAETLPLSHGLHRTQGIPNQLVIEIARQIKLKVSYMLHPYSLQRSPPGPRLPKRIGNAQPRNYYNRKGKKIDVHFLFQVEPVAQL